MGLICIVAGTRAQDRVFTYTYQSGVLNKGQKEIEVWSTLSGGRNNFYKGLDHKLEFEIGLGGKLQTSFYLNYGNSSAVVEENGIQILANSTDYSFSNEWKLKLSDPVANRIGSALYFEYSLAPTETAFEGKLILDKQFGKFTNAFNLVGEYEIEHAFTPEGNKLRSENTGKFTLELNYGLSCKVKDHFSVGLEAMNQNQLSGSNLYFYLAHFGLSVGRLRPPNQPFQDIQRIVQRNCGDSCFLQFARRNHALFACDDSLRRAVGLHRHDWHQARFKPFWD